MKGQPEERLRPVIDKFGESALVAGPIGCAELGRSSANGVPDYADQLTGGIETPLHVEPIEFSVVQEG
jgi:hypothetical protein